MYIFWVCMFIYSIQSYVHDYENGSIPKTKVMLFLFCIPVTHAYAQSPWMKSTVGSLAMQKWNVSRSIYKILSVTVAVARSTFCQLFGLTWKIVRFEGLCCMRCAHACHLHPFSLVVTRAMLLFRIQSQIGLPFAMGLLYYALQH